MKKLFLILAATVVLFACGGGKKKSQEDPYTKYLDLALEALKAGDIEKVASYEEQYDEWYESLSEAEQEIADEKYLQWMEKNEDAVNEAYEKAVEEQAVAYYEQMMNADGDWDKMGVLMEEIEKWYDGLSEEDQEKADAAIEKAMYGDLVGEEDEEDDDWYSDEEEDEYEYEEVEEVTPVAVTNDWDEYLDIYEDFVDGYIRVSKKAMNGDVNAALELSELAIELGEYAEELEDAADEMSVSQAARLVKISDKISKAML